MPVRTIPATSSRSPAPSNRRSQFAAQPGKPWCLVLGFLLRLRQRRQQRLLARAQHWLEACQCAAENHPGLYEALVHEAELAVATLEEANPQQK